MTARPLDLLKDPFDLGVIDFEDYAENPMAWQERALCAQTDPEVFFPEQGRASKSAKQTCLACDVRQDCLDYALENDERFGIWGGLGERERRRLQAQRTEALEGDSGAAQSDTNAVVG